MAEIIKEVKRAYSIDDKGVFHVMQVITMEDGTVRNNDITSRYGKPVLDMLEAKYKEELKKE